MLFKQHSKSSPLNSTQYAMLYPQNGDKFCDVTSHYVYCARDSGGQRRLEQSARRDPSQLIAGHQSINH